MFNMRFAFGNSVGSLIREGDRARDAKQWRSAVTYYERVVAAQPALVAIWVQLGHARKECGDLAAAETAYRAALQLEPNSADTALHMGHLHKVAQRLEDAVAWYRRSLQLDRRNIHAREELAAIARLDNDYWVADSHAATIPPPPIRRLFWDCTRQWSLERTGTFCAEGKWFIELGMACSRNFDVTPVVFDQNSGRFLCCSFEDMSIERRDPLTLPGARGLDIALVTSPTGCTSSTELIRMLSSAHSQLNMRIIGVVRNAITGQPTSGSSSPTNSGNVELLGLLERSATALLVRHGGDRELSEDIARRIGRDHSMVFALDPRPSVDPERAITTTSRPSKRILVLEPLSPLDQPALEIQLRKFHHDKSAGAQTPLLVSHDESLHAYKSVQLRNLGEIITPADAWNNIANSSIYALLIPASRSDGDIWAAHALAHGLKVLCHASNHSVFDFIGGSASYFSDDQMDDTGRSPSNPCFSNSPVSPLAVARPSEGGAYTPWINALQAIAAAPEEYAPPHANFARYGVFYGSEAVVNSTRQYSEAEGRSMLMGSGWGPTDCLGTSITNDNAQIHFQLPFPPDDSIECKALLYCASSYADDASLQLTWLDLEAEAADIESTPGASSYFIRIGHGCQDHMSLKHPTHLAGFLIYPRKRDHYWHEFLDRSSRSILSFRNLPSYRPRSLTQQSTAQH